MAAEKVVLPKVTLPGVRENKIIPKRKLEYAEKLKVLLSEYNKCLVVTVDNVGSKQVGMLRKRFRGRARFLFGKNTLIRKVIREYIKETRNGKLMSLMDLVTGNSGFVFTHEEVAPLRKEIMVESTVQCPAKAGQLAPADVWVEPGPTGMEPTQTGFFQSMDIPTRINRGQIDISERVQIIAKGDKVGLSESQLCSKLNIKPFYFGIIVASVYDDGEAYAASVLDLTKQDIANAFYGGLRQVAALSFGISYPTLPIVPHATINAYKKILALGLGFEKYSWENLALVKEMLANPGAFAASGGGGAAAATGGGAAAAPDKEPTPEESSAAANTNMFGDDDSESGSS